MNFKYCLECGSKLDKKEIGDEGIIPFCTICNKPLFDFSYPCVLCLAVDDDNMVVLIKQSYVSEYYVCIAGYVKQGETIENAAKREVEEEIGLEVLNVKYIKSYYYEKRDNLMFGFICKVKKSEFNISKEVDEADWFSLDAAHNLLKPGSIAEELFLDYLQINKKIMIDT